MARRSLLERFEGLEGRRATLEAELVGRNTPTEIHVAVIDTLSNLLRLGNMLATDKVPAPLRAMMRTLDMMKPTLVEELAQVPPDQIRQFFGELREQIDAICNTGSGPAANGHHPEELPEGGSTPLIDGTP